MSEINSGERVQNPATVKLTALLNELTQVFSVYKGRNGAWDNKALNKITVLQTAIQTIPDLPRGMTVKDLEESVREIINQKP